MSKKKRTSKDKTRENAEAQKEEVEVTTANKVIPKKESAPIFPVPDGKFDVPVPDGFEWGKYRALKKSAFQADNLYYLHRAADFVFRIEQLQKKVNYYGDLADEAQRFGSDEGRKKVQRLKKAQKKADDLRQELAAEGMDVDSLMEE